MFLKYRFLPFNSKEAKSKHLFTLLFTLSITLTSFSIKLFTKPRLKWYWVTFCFLVFTLAHTLLSSSSGTTSTNTALRAQLLQLHGNHLRENHERWRGSQMLTARHCVKRRLKGTISPRTEMGWFGMTKCLYLNEVNGAWLTFFAEKERNQANNYFSPADTPTKPFFAVWLKCTKNSIINL